MSRYPRRLLLPLGLLLVLTQAAFAQPLGAPDRGQPGDRAIQTYLATETQRIQDKFAGDIQSLAQWQQARPQYREEYFHMLGLWPLPEKTPLQATVTGTIAGEGYTVENLHYQSQPRLYVTGNLYRPTNIAPGAKLPAVLYVCGHSNCGRDGGKTVFQSHGIWFAKHGYVCLIVDTLQLGEIPGIHHGTYNKDRWWWHSRGYTSAGVECWNGVRGIDYLISRPDVDPEKIAVTGISGGGAATIWIAAADERVKVSVPVSGMADLESYVPNRVINGHCDCMFLYNTFEWPWTRIAALIAPRPLLFANSDQDRIFPMDANERVINRLERLYSLYGASDQVDAMVSIGGHAYRQDLRQSIYRFINAHLKDDPRPITDSEADLDKEASAIAIYPIDTAKLRVFPTDADLPKDELNTTIDRHFTPIAQVPTPTRENLAAWRSGLLSELRRVTFRTLPERIEPARELRAWTASTDAERAEGSVRLQSEPGVPFELRYAPAKFPKNFQRVLLVISAPEAGNNPPAWLKEITGEDTAVIFCDPRGTGDTRWTTTNPPNYVLRSHALLGRTVDTGRVHDVAAAARYVKNTFRREGRDQEVAVTVAGAGAAGVIGAYAAVLEPDITAVTLIEAPLTHMDANAPAFLNILRVCDIPDMLGLLAPRQLNIRVLETELDESGVCRSTQKLIKIYQAAAAEGRLEILN